MSDTQTKSRRQLQEELMQEIVNIVCSGLSEQFPLRALDSQQREAILSAIAQYTLQAAEQ